MNHQPKKVEAQLFGKSFVLETGTLAKQTNGAVLARSGDTVVLATVVAAKEKTEGEDFLPLTVNYQEKSAAAGKIPGRKNLICGILNIRAEGLKVFAEAPGRMTA